MYKYNSLNLPDLTMGQSLQTHAVQATLLKPSNVKNCICFCSGTVHVNEHQYKNECKHTGNYQEYKFASVVQILNTSSKDSKYVRLTFWGEVCNLMHMTQFIHWLSH